MQKLIFLFSVLLIVGCSEESGKLLPKPLPLASQKQSFEGVKLSFNANVDILFVVDSSGSMSPHQNNLSNNIQLFTQNLSKLSILDYHIGVTTTDMRSNPGHLRGNPRYIDKNTANAELLLAQNIKVGTSGGAIESVFFPVVQGLSAPNVNTVNSGFYREDAYIALIFITDAADQSAFSEYDFFSFMENLKGGKVERVLSYGVIVPTGVDDCARDWGDDPVKIESFIRMVKGSYFSLCDRDYGRKLTEVGQDLVNRIKLFVPLEVFPIVSTIKVTYGGYVLPNDSYYGWTYDPHRVGIHLGKGIEIPEQYKHKGAKLEIDYKPVK